MKIALNLNLNLSPCECETLFQLSINHPRRDVRLRASGLLMLSKGEHPSAIGQQCGVSHQTIYNWRHAWEQEGLVGLISGHAGGRPRKLSEAWLATVCELVRTEALTLRGIVQRAEAIHGLPFPLSLDRLGVILRKSGFSFKRTRMSLENRNPERFAACASELAGLKTWAREGGCQLFYYDEAGFSASPPVQRACSPVGSAHAATPAHHQRVAVMEALDFAGQRLHRAQALATVNRETFIDFMAGLIPSIAKPVPTFIILDNARIHHGLEESLTLRWMKEFNTFLCYLPPYSPELNMIEILWKQAKYHWREFTTWSKDSFRSKISELLDGFGSKFQISFT